MSNVEAIFRRGVFQPLGPVSLLDEERVTLHIEPSEARTAPAEALEWLRQVQELQSAIRRRRGDLPDSAPEIAADRAR